VKSECDDWRDNFPNFKVKPHVTQRLGNGDIRNITNGVSLPQSGRAKNESSQLVAAYESNNGYIVRAIKCITQWVFTHLPDKFMGMSQSAIFHIHLRNTIKLHGTDPSAK
jgi:hypothetical protein